MKAEPVTDRIFVKRTLVQAFPSEELSRLPEFASKASVGCKYSLNPSKSIVVRLGDSGTPDPVYFIIGYRASAVWPSEVGDLMPIDCRMFLSVPQRPSIYGFLVMFIAYSLIDVELYKSRKRNRKREIQRGFCCYIERALLPMLAPYPKISSHEIFHTESFIAMIIVRKFTRVRWNKSTPVRFLRLNTRRCSCVYEYRSLDSSTSVLSPYTFPDNNLLPLHHRK